MTYSAPAHHSDTIQHPHAFASIVAFMRDFSLEATRPRPADVEELRRAAAPGTAIYLSALPRRPTAEIVGHAVMIRAAGFEPVPHLAARHFPDRAALDDVLQHLAKEAGVRRVLVISGDRDRAEGPFASALDVVESGLLQRHGIAEIGISGYPEGHPRVATSALDRALAAKIESAEQSGLKVHIVTQFGFDADAICRWIGRLRDLGFDQPVRIGMAGPTDLTTLLRYAARCGVRASAGSAARQAGLLKHLFGVSAPDPIVRALAQAKGLGEIAAHFFSFGGLGASARWATAAAAGGIELDTAGGFTVTPP